MSDSTFMTFERIKQLKARYFRFVDTQNWDGLNEVFSENAQLQWGPEDDQVMKGRATIVSSLKANLEGAKTTHHGHMPEIELIDENNARGIWAMNDTIDHPDYDLIGVGHYHEEYVRQGGEWRIHRLKLTRLSEVRTPKNGSGA